MRCRRIIGTILLPAYLSSCTSWVVQRIQPSEVLEKEPAEIMVQLRGSDQELLLKHPRMVGDTVVGLPLKYSWGRSGFVADDSASERRIPLDSVAQIKVKEKDTWKTLGALAAVASAGLIAAKLVASVKKQEQCQSGDAIARNTCRLRQGN